MLPSYMETHFSYYEEISSWPKEFAIITAFATTGEVWTDIENQLADKALESKLKEFPVWVKRLTGYSPTTGHAEQGWAASIDWNLACDIGLEFKQDAIYFVSDDRLTVSYCDKRRKPVLVGYFSKRIRNI